MRTDYDASQARKAMLLEGLSLAVHGVLFPFGFLKSRHRSIRRRDLRTVVFVHGLAANRAGFFPLQTYLRYRGYDRQVSFNHRSGPSIEALAIELKRAIDREVKGGRIDIIAHSLGGLVARFYLQALGGARRVDRLITLGTPHLGTHASMFVPSAFVRQLKPLGPFLEHLNALPVPEGVSCCAFAGGADALVLPRESALGFGDGTLFPGLGHTQMLLSPSVFRAVRATLSPT